MSFRGKYKEVGKEVLVVELFRVGLVLTFLCCVALLYPGFHLRRGVAGIIHTYCFRSFYVYSGVCRGFDLVGYLYRSRNRRVLRSKPFHNKTLVWMSWGPVRGGSSYTRPNQNLRRNSFCPKTVLFQPTVTENNRSGGMNLRDG